ncbi:MAG: hypothetical protein PHY86_00620 [Candidatus Gracilibacteria bacterium]|nr:hypothetical protein [Candidatus Gracilibacteria bacterium]
MKGKGKYLLPPFSPRKFSTRRVEVLCGEWGGENFLVEKKI